MPRLTKPCPLLLLILDGWGYREHTEYNAIAAAKKPNWDALWHQYPHSILNGSGRCVGLPEGQMGNSEVGHLHMGAGRIVNQDLTRIDEAIESGTFNDNEALNYLITSCKENNRAIHCIGLLSPGGVHSHEKHLHAFITLAKKRGFQNLFIHAFLDGRDTPPMSAKESLTSLIEHCHEEKTGSIASLIGRYYAMDRDKRWDRVEAAYRLLTEGTASSTSMNALEGLHLAYERGETDEFVKPTAILGKDGQPVSIQPGDAILFFNFRADRARELTTAFLNPTLVGFPIKHPITLSHFVSFTEYDATLKTTIAFPSQPLTHLLGEEMSRHGFTQLRIAETEKYAHVTFFFNGGQETPYPGETRLLIPSPKVATYDLCPEMSAHPLTDALIDAILSESYQLIVCNFANPDMVGHTGNFEATVKAIEVIDHCLGRIVNALQSVQGEMIITADHGNAEKMYDDNTKQPHTAHTTDPVPFLYIGRTVDYVKSSGQLSDIAPTILTLLNLPIPSEMNGKPLVTPSSPQK